MTPLVERLPQDRTIFVPDMLGHGGRPVPDGHTLAEIVADLIAQCDAQDIGRADWFGYSFGGFVALWLAAHRPERVRSIATLAAKFVYDDRTVDHLTHLVSMERLGREDSPRAKALAVTHHPQDWTRVARNNGALYASFRDAPPLAHDELRQIAAPALLLAGQRDPIVSASETQLIAELLPNARAKLFAGSSHPLPAAPLDAIARDLTRFTADPERAVRVGKVDLLRFRFG